MGEGENGDEKPEAPEKYTGRTHNKDIWVYPVRMPPGHPDIFCCDSLQS